MRVSRMRLKTPEERERELREKRERKRRAREGAKRAESMGRPIGAVEGRWVTDLAEIRQSIVLCWSCDAKWRTAAPKYGYEITNWSEIWGGVVGKCDGCRSMGPHRKFYAHGSLLPAISSRS